jgi:very-short-patch-repair endonuclease
MKFEGSRHSKIVQDYAQLDKQYMLLHRQDIAYKLSLRSIPDGKSQGPRKSWTELSLIKNEIAKQMRHIPIRQLMLRAFKATRCLKPCFMMSPISVAQFLPTNSTQFDIVVMDEASQLKPEDAMGVIARGKQLIVVGDTKQLPPSSFFDRSMNSSLEVDDEPENEILSDEFESILEQASGIFTPARRLKWHYRSQHESLIAFSNSEFYDNELILFPTAKAKSEELGIKHVFVEDGVYEASRNVNEARAIVKAIIQHAQDKPHESLGVVAMNSSQKDLIEELILNEAKDNPFLAKFITEEETVASKTLHVRESFFVKNLENVQGDERDVIFISVTYGKDKDGSFHHRFGPINHKNGYRRLNVLFSRSKKRMHIFCSFHSGLLSGASSAGAQALKKFLVFSETGILKDHDNITGKLPDSPFEYSVMRALKNLGYDVVPQVGVAGYFIDLAIRDPRNPNSFLLAVECDGATYHSSKSARDRDRLRQQNLENLGWKVHRIWSTDWFKNDKRELKLLQQKIDSLLEAAKNDADKAPTKKENTVAANSLYGKEALRKDLIDLRERTIKPKYPKVRSEEGLLRMKVLDIIIESSPTTEEMLITLLIEKHISFANEHKEFISTVISLINKKQGILI